MPQSRLLHWGTLVHKNNSNIAAIRFAAPVCISSIRIFPTGAIPFANAPEIVATTRPDAFFLDVLLNALHINPQPKAKDRPLPSNALVPTVLAYTGGQCEFTIDMGPEYATRLMIFRGNFEIISVALYGVPVDVLTPRTLQTYSPRSLPSIQPLPLSPSIDVANSHDPTSLARSLLALIPGSPPLQLVVCLMFCLKPPEDDWDLPDFPYLHADLDAASEKFDLKDLVQLAARPIKEDTTYDVLTVFADRVADFIGPQDADQAYYFAELLSLAASQHPDMARALLDAVELSSVFEAQYLDEVTLLHLLEASSNAAIAHHFHEHGFVDTLKTVDEAPNVKKHTQSAARRLSARVKAWSGFEEVLSNTAEPSKESIDLLKDVGLEEASLGIWLETMMLHPELVSKLADNPAISGSTLAPLSMSRDDHESISHGQFVALVRAYLGVATVLAVFAWADSLGNDSCRERTLGVLNLWQSVDGYREIVNHLLLLRQLTRRLEWITSDNDPPRKSGTLAERVLSNLVKDPTAILREDLMKSILSLHQPLSFITESERLSMRKLALVAEDGVPAAIEELVYTSDRPLSLRRLRTLRVSLALLARELTEEHGEWQTLQVLWDKDLHGLLSRLVDILASISEDLNAHLSLSPMAAMNQPLMEQLFQTAEELIHMITRLLPGFPLTSRELRHFAVAVVDLFVNADTADILTSSTSLASKAAHRTRNVILSAVQALVEPEVFADSGVLAAEVIVRTLLEHALHPQDKDPVQHALQIFVLIDHILPQMDDVYEDDNSLWVLSVLPSVLPEIKTFLRILDSGNKAHFIRRLAKLDNGNIGLGEWLLMEELRLSSEALHSLAESPLSTERQLMNKHQVSLSLHFLVALLIPSSHMTEWFATSVQSSVDLSRRLENFLDALTASHLSSPVVTGFSVLMANSAKHFDPALQSSLLSSLLRIVQVEYPNSDLVEAIHTTIAASVLSPTQALRTQVGRMFAVISEQSVPLTEAMSLSLLGILKWLSNDKSTPSNTLPGVSSTTFANICDSMLLTLSELDESFDAITQSFTLLDNEESHPTPEPSSPLPDTIQLSVQDIQDLIHGREGSAPSTPVKRNTPDILGLIISPPTALLRSPAATGLTKTYTNNDFRQLRQIPSVRQNTSRLPSMHVDVGINGHLA